MVWVLKDAPGLKPHLGMPLMGLANHADHEGKGAWPSQETLARYCRKTSRGIRKDLAQLEEDGLIRRGNQLLVAHIPADERPVVWDLTIERTTKERNCGAAPNVQSDTGNGTPVPGGPTVPPGTTAQMDRNCGTGGTGTPVPTNRPSTIHNQTSLSSPDGADHETSSKRSKQSSGQGTRLPDDFTVTSEMKAWAQTNVPQLAGAGETDKFVDYWRSIPGAKGRKTDWVATWRNWMRKAAESQAQIPGQRPASTAPQRLDRDEMCPKHWGQDREHCRECRADRLAGDLDGDL
jgi:hypothetical protein